MDNGVAFLNLEYIFLKIYNLFHSIDVDTLPYQWAIISYYAELVGFVLAVVFLIGIVYAQLRYMQIMQAIWKRRDEQIAALQNRTESRTRDERWEKILELINSPNENDWRRAVIDADIILGGLL